MQLERSQGMINIRVSTWTCFFIAGVVVTMGFMQIVLFTSVVSQMHQEHTPSMVVREVREPPVQQQQHQGPLTAAPIPPRKIIPPAPARTQADSDCQAEWSAWSSCDVHSCTRSRTYNVLSRRVGDGVECRFKNGHKQADFCLTTDDVRQGDMSSGCRASSNGVVAYDRNTDNDLRFGLYKKRNFRRFLREYGERHANMEISSDDKHSCPADQPIRLLLSHHRWASMFEGDIVRRWLEDGLESRCRVSCAVEVENDAGVGTLDSPQVHNPSNRGVSFQHVPHVVVQHSNRGLFTAHAPWQKAAVYAMEVGGQWKFEEDLRHTDILASLSQHSEVLITRAETYSHDNKRGFNIARDFHSFTNTAIANAWISNCHDANRAEYLAELMQYIKVDSFGSCQHNLPEQWNRTLDYTKHWEGKDKGWNERWLDKEKVASNYMFYLAFENHLFDDYVSEKVWAALAYGNIPVVRGAPNINDWLPHESAVINALDFANAKELADYMLLVSSDKRLYEKHTRWRVDPALANTRKEWLKKWTTWSNGSFLQTGADNWLCRVCEHYSEHYCQTAPA